MAVTQNQVNAGKALVLDRAFMRYPHIRKHLVRIAVQAIKAGNATEKEVGKAILNQAWTAIKGSTPVGNHEFKHWLYDGLGDNGDDPTTGVSNADAFEAEAVTVN